VLNVCEVSYVIMYVKGTMCLIMNLFPIINLFLTDS